MRRDQARLELKDGHEGLEQKRLAKPFNVQSTDETGNLEGHGAVFDVPHPTSSWALDPEWKDVIRPGAFKKTLAENKKAGIAPVMLYMHERGNVVGAWRDVVEDGDGLAMKGQVALSAKAPSGATIHELLKMGAITGLSIGFRVRKHALDQEKKTREILDVELSEVSIVDVPGNGAARITDVKAGDLRNPQFLESVLRDAGLSRKEAKALLAKGFNALRDAEANPEPDLRDAGRSGSNDEAAELLKAMADFRAQHEF